MPLFQAESDRHSANPTHHRCHSAVRHITMPSATPPLSLSHPTCKHHRLTASKSNVTTQLPDKPTLPSQGLPTTPILQLSHQTRQWSDSAARHATTATHPPNTQPKPLSDLIYHHIHMTLPLTHQCGDIRHATQLSVTPLLSLSMLLPPDKPPCCHCSHNHSNARQVTATAQMTNISTLPPLRLPTTPNPQLSPPTTPLKPLILRAHHSHHAAAPPLSKAICHSTAIH